MSYLSGRMTPAGSIENQPETDRGIRIMIFMSIRLGFSLAGNPERIGGFSFFLRRATIPDGQGNVNVRRDAAMGIEKGLCLRVEAVHAAYVAFLYGPLWDRFSPNRTFLHHHMILHQQSNELSTVLETFS
jgi:hypothetical protein